MTDQLVLDLGPIVEPDIARDATITERFEAFHQANPWVADALHRLAVDLLNHGQSRVGMKQLFEVLRWHSQRATSGDEFKLNNDFTSRYARLLAERHPELAGVFETRALRAA